MGFKDILGYDTIKGYLKVSAEAGHIPYAQLFVASEGQGASPMAIVYVTLVLNQNNPKTIIQCAQLTHPDLHFAFPTSVSDKVKKDPVSSLFTDEWRTFIKEQPYGSLFGWLSFLDIEKEQAVIGVNEAKEIANELVPKSFEGGYKVTTIWMTEKMNIDSVNRLLKLLEEPAEKALLLLIVGDENVLLDTIKLKCQILRFLPLGRDAIREGLIAKGVAEAEATKIAICSQGNRNRALQLIQNEENKEAVSERRFIAWVWSAYRARDSKAAIQGLLQWSEEVNTIGREVQK